MKLGFAIKTVCEGAKDPIYSNDGRWKEKIGDYRSSFSYFRGLWHSQKKLTRLEFAENGTFISIMRPIHARTNDHIAASIYVPTGMDITGKEILDAYNFACEVINEPDPSKKEEDFKKFFEKEYKNAEDPLVYKASSAGEKYALRHTNESQIGELIGDKRYQEYYANYKAIFIVDDDVMVAEDYKHELDDLTKMPLKEYVKLAKTDGKKLKGLKIDNLAFTEDGAKFEGDQTIEKGATIKLTAKRTGFNDFPLPAFTASERRTEVCLPESIEWKKTINPSSILVRDEKGREVEGAVIKINNNTITNDKSIVLTEKECKEARISVQASGYEHKEKMADLTKSARIEMEIESKEKECKGSIVLSDGQRAEISIKARGLKNSSNMLNGYKYDSMSNFFYTDSKLIWIQRLIGAAFATCSIFIVWACITFVSWWGTIKSVEFKFGLPPIEFVKKNNSKNIDQPTKKNSTGKPSKLESEEKEKAEKTNTEKKEGKKTKSDNIQSDQGEKKDLSIPSPDAQKKEKPQDTDTK